VSVRRIHDEFRTCSGSFLVSGRENSFQTHIDGVRNGVPDPSRRGTNSFCHQNDGQGWNRTRVGSGESLQLLDALKRCATSF
jgi:hypothetical protein